MNRQDYFAKKELNKQTRVDAGLVSDRFPGVSGIVIQMIYYRKLANPVHMIRTINFFPTSYAYFNMECMMKECVDGGFNLASVISSLVKKHKKLVKGKMVCRGECESLASHHASISYEINIQYSKQSK